MIAIVPARGGSKGLPGKNTKEIFGKPLIAHTIVQALKAKQISEIILSTDSKEIAEIAVKYGAKNPFFRPTELATDNAKAIDNYIYTVNKLNTEFNYHISEFIVLQPTSPLRRAEDIDNAIELFYSNNANSVISITELEHPLQWAKKINEKNQISEYFHHDLSPNLNRQELPVAYRPNGAIFIFKFDLLTEKYSYYSEKSFGFIMPQETSVDIDTLLDFEFAEFLMRKRNERN